MQLPVMPPVAPMLAKAIKADAGTPDGWPDDPGFAFEPKWDGMRCVVFRDGDEIELGSRTTRTLTRYFPELYAALAEQLPPRCVVDGEIIVSDDGRLDFEALVNRIHPAASRVAMLAEQTPASFVAFDLLALGSDSLLQTPFRQRREQLVAMLAGARAPLHVTPLTRDAEQAREWFHHFEGAGLDGIIVKRLDDGYHPGERTMLKIKHERTADCVVAGYRWHKDSTADRPLVGSLLLGLYDGHGDLHHVGVVAAFSAARRAELVTELAPYADAGAEHPWAAWGGAGAEAGGATVRTPGSASRWSNGKDLSWQPLRPQRVVEVRYDHLEGTRFRHTAQFLRWREDRDARDCDFGQLDVVLRADVSGVLQ